MDNLFCCNSISDQQITTNICTWHGRTAALSCAKFCSDHCLSKFGWEQNQICWEFESWWKYVSEISPQELIIKDYRDLKEYQNKQGHMAAGIGWPPTTLRLRQNGCQMADGIFKGNLLNENITVLIKFQHSLFLWVWLAISQNWFR